MGDVWNDLTEEDAKEHIGPKGIEALMGLMERLFPSPVEAPRRIAYRFAPSVIARSEAELLGLSTPRFAIRAYLDPQRQYFVNARRIERFADSARRDWDVLRDPSGNPHGYKFQRPFRVIVDGGTARRPTFQKEWLSPGALIRDASCIGDSLLAFSTDRERFHILTVELGRAYGEGRGIEGTPFVNHIKFFGGGMCAQAVAFMAMALRHNDADAPRPSVYGPAESTALARGTELRHIELSGLGPQDLCTLFDRALVVPREDGKRPQTYVRQWSMDDSNRPGGGSLTMVLRAYLRAGASVVFPVEASYLAGADRKKDHALPTLEDCIYAKNLPPERLDKIRLKRRGLRAVASDDADSSESESRLHAVLLVGCEKADGSEVFRFNDPSTYPFLSATMTDLCAASPPSTPMAPHSFIAVPPAAVRLPIYRWSPNLPFVRTGITTVQPGAGLADLAQNMQSRHDGFGQTILKPLMAGRTKGKAPPARPASPVGRLWLLRVGALSDSAELSRKPDPVPAKLHEALADLRRVALSSLRRRADHWVWVQYLAPTDSADFGETLWVWDAERNLPRREIRGNERTGAYSGTDDDYEMALKFLVGAGFFDGAGRWTRVPHDAGKVDARTTGPTPKVPAVSKRPHATSAATRLSPAMITSVSFRGASHVLQGWPNQVGVEVYTFMEGDRCMPVASGGQRKNNCQRLADFQTSPGSLHKVASEIRRHAIGQQIVALASFIPELTSAHSQHDGIQALIFLRRLAHELRTTHRGLAAIEVVAGSRIERVCPFVRVAKPDAEPGFLAEQWPARAEGQEDAAINLLADGLRRVVGANAGGGATIPLAVEVEPGPLYVLQDKATLLNFCAKLTGALQPAVGINLDVAHFALAGIEPEWVLDHPAVRNRIVHCHLSDHGRGHFGDVVPGDLGLGTHGAGTTAKPLAAFQPWIDLMRTLAADERPEGYPAMSRSVSLELEMCKDAEQVKRAVQHLKQMLS